MYVQQELPGIQIRNMNMDLRDKLIVRDGTCDVKGQLGTYYRIINWLGDSYCGGFTVILEGASFVTGNYKK